MTFEEMRTENMGKSFTFDEMVEFFKNNLRVSLCTTEDPYSSGSSPVEVKGVACLGEIDLVNDKITVYRD